MNFESHLYFCGDDMMKRGIYAQNFKRIIKECHSFPKNNDNNSYVIGIDAPWGSGKTFFVQMLSSYLEGHWEKPNLSGPEKERAISGTGANEIQEDNDVIPVVYYNAWKNDFWDNAFEPLFDHLIKSSPMSLIAAEEEARDLIKTATKIIALGIKGFAAKRIDDYFDKDTIVEINKELGKLCNDATNTNYLIEEIFPEYVLFKEAIDAVRKYLSEAVKNCKKIVIIIDELDRCKPTFAVQTLEIVKHLFNIEGLVFVFALDINQLSHCVKVVYGNSFDAIGYLERFFNYLTILPQGKMSSKEQYSSFFYDMELQDIPMEVAKRLVWITDDYNLSLREIKTVLSAYSVLLKTVLKQYTKYPDAMVLYFYFLCMKYKHPIMFSDGVFRNKPVPIITHINNHKIPFSEWSSIGLLNNQIATQIKSGEVNKRCWYQLRNNGRYIYNGTSVIDYNITNCRLSNNTLICDGEALGTHNLQVPLVDGISLNNLLYYPDLLRFEEIGEYTLLQFIFRQLEMCDFIH